MHLGLIVPLDLSVIQGTGPWNTDVTAWVPAPGVRAFIRERKALTLTENQVILTENHYEFQLESVTSKNLHGNLSSEPFPGRKQVIPCHAVPNKGADLKERHGCEHLKGQDNAYTPLGTSQGPCGCSMMVGLKGACPKNSREVQATAHCVYLTMGEELRRKGRLGQG